MLISEHADGEIIARIAHSARLSHGARLDVARRGAALLGLARELENGRELAVTPDGPRGPAQVVRAGSAHRRAAHRRADHRASACSVSRAWRLKSWDRFIDSQAVRARERHVQRRERVDATNARDAADEAERFEAAMDARASSAREWLSADARFVERVWYGDGRDVVDRARGAAAPAERVFRRRRRRAGHPVRRGLAAERTSTAIPGGERRQSHASAERARRRSPRGSRASSRRAARNPRSCCAATATTSRSFTRTLNPDGARDRRARIASPASPRRPHRGADIAVLDDAFQHRRVRRAGGSRARQRGPMDAATCICCRPARGASRSRRVRRATLVIVTRKAASDAGGRRGASRVWRSVAPAVPRVSVRSRRRATLVRRGRIRASTDRSTVLWGARSRDPVDRRSRAFVAQLERAARACAGRRLFPITTRSPTRKSRVIASERRRSDWLVCTLKDAVKLGPRWPRLAPPLWYVSQHVMVERGVGGHRARAR